jgi:hypothetical protein
MLKNLEWDFISANCTRKTDARNSKGFLYFKNLLSLDVSIAVITFLLQAFNCNGGATAVLTADAIT